MKKKTLKKIIGIFLSTSLIFTTVGAANLDYADAKSRSRSSSSRSSSKSSKPSSSKSSSKPKASTSSNSKPSTSSKSSSSTSSSSSTRTRHFSSSSRYNSNYNSFNNEEYKKKYMNYLNNNYRSSGFFTRSSVVNGILWGLLFNSLSSSHKVANATNEQKELAENIKASKVPVYMIEVKTKNGETKYATVTKEQYDKIKEGDEISLKNGNLEIKSSKQ